MLSTTKNWKVSVAASGQAARITKAALISATMIATPDPQIGMHLGLYSSRRSFLTTPCTRLKDFFPPKDTNLIQTTPPAWPHQGFTMEEMLAVKPAHRKPRTFGDWVAWKTVRFARYWMDKATGMDRDQQIDKRNPTVAVDAKKPLTEAQWVRPI
ncbi:hypothetical protein NLG97_g8019 [Lecanicillium saksenae]|uniref:Uncharacterized protein n=1 Tax=Lecanicillium saksenae TaxID=468837 RepID=A0ACC1QLT9_9HYPO|nr:hypothetical protein NLG97_g8019 [Lecanicillium saksenae]